MGALRLMLALSVFMFHTNTGFHLVGGPIAVEAFFMISGYVMFLILGEKYHRPGFIIRFYGARLLRLFPAYAVIALLAAVSAVLFHISPFTTWVASAHSTGFFSIFLSASAQITLLGQDVLSFLSVHPATGHLYVGTGSPLAGFSLLPTAWSLSLELWFYALAPFFARSSTRTLLLFFLASLLLRILFSDVFHLPHDPWIYRFFPTQLVFFLAGGLAYRWRSSWQTLLRLPFIPQSICLFILIVTGNFISFVPQSMGPILLIGPKVMPIVQGGMYYSLLFLTLPLLFAATRHSRIDRFIGHTAYPVYLIHPLIFELNRQLQLGWSVSMMLFSVLLFSCALVFLLEEPINTWRQSIAGHIHSVTLPRVRVLTAAGFLAGFLIFLFLASQLPHAGTVIS
jgi:peptidoglycan/LPS O-acetylase OafA/YrhL